MRGPAAYDVLNCKWITHEHELINLLFYGVLNHEVNFKFFLSENLENLDICR